MLKFYKILFLSSLVTGTLISVSSYSWFSMWMGLEINLLSIIPLMSSTNNLYPSESALKYFITQTLASSILLFSIVTMMNLNEFIPQNSNFIMTMGMNSALLTKMGAAPFHFWFPEVMEGLNWNNSLLMLTWQKLAPMVLIMYNSKMILFLSAIIICSSIIGGLQGINQVSMRKILAYSSINHIGWMVASMLTVQTTWLIYFSIYSTISVNIILILKNLNIFYLNQLIGSLNQNKMMKFLFFLNFLSLGGIPPFLGFFPKWMTVNNLIMNSFFLLSLILIVMTLITLFFYLRIMFSSLVLNLEENLITKAPKTNWSVISFNVLTILAMAACFLIFNLN